MNRDTFVGVLCVLAIVVMCSLVLYKNASGASCNCECDRSALNNNPSRVYYEDGTSENLKLNLDHYQPYTGEK